MRDFKKYGIWKLSHKLTLNVCKISEDHLKSKIYGITSQIRRASSSIPTNIVGEAWRDSNAEFKRFLTIALGSTNETEYVILLSKDLGYIDTPSFENLTSKVNLIKKKMYSLKKNSINNA